MEAIAGEILVVPFFGQGHLFPSMELCRKFSSFNYKSTLLIPSHLSSSVPSDLRRHSSVQVVEISAASLPPPPPPEMNAPPPHPFRQDQQRLGGGIESFLAERYGGAAVTRPDCVVVDVMMSWSKEIFAGMGIPIVSFFTCGACSAAMEFAAWKNKADELKPGETRFLPGLPQHMALTHSETQRRHRHAPPPHLHRGNGFVRPGPNGPGGPRGPGRRPHWLDGVESSIAVLINTCDDLERPFIEYLSNQIQKPIWGVGPSLPAQFWESAGSILHDHQVRSSNRSSNFTEEEVVQWLNSKPDRSVIYVSFGSEVAPTMEESEELANALEESNRPFIWVIQPGSGKPGPPASLFGDKTPGSDPADEGYYPHGLQERIGNKGLIIKGWAPQLLILSHPSTGGFLSHCGWNSTLESIGRGVPILAWPIRGDQFFDAKLIANHLKVGHIPFSDKDVTETVKKDEIVRGIDKLMSDEEVHSRAMALKSKFEVGFPESSTTSINSFIKLVAK
ncbi:PREDICTED: scopoletin glucosyltransferase-like [Ipomoea nil]|uniref:scopoletin glucosyltransferase-like n=1 Tax=Ipomoea nil TaxID=35883 RepID=UPI00090105C1|nr:PREDICTED: scopoletin glucosyltransferase-like [Ipomoea nil]